jgi:GNAT acetyltransferase-like protein
VNDRALLRTHVGTLFTQDSAGRLLAINQPGGKPAPRFFLGWTNEGPAWWIRADLPDHLEHSLTAICTTMPIQPELSQAVLPAQPFVSVLEHQEAVQRIWAGPAFRFPADLDPSPVAVPITHSNAEVLRPYLAPWQDDVARGQTLYAVLHDGAAVSVCASVRCSAAAEEAGVETAVAFRGKGYAAPAVRAWAIAVRKAGRTPLYSTAWTNGASLALARKLALVQFANDLHIT